MGTRSRLVVVALVLALSAPLALPAGAVASNASLRLTLNAWSQKIAADARSLVLAAQHRHPRRMTTRALRFTADARRGRAAIADQRASSPRGVRARGLALRAFFDYAAAGKGWTASGRALLRGQGSASSRYASTAGRFARAGNLLLVSAGRLLR